EATYGMLAAPLVAADSNNTNVLTDVGAVMTESATKYGVYQMSSMVNPSATVISADASSGTDATSNTYFGFGLKAKQLNAIGTAGRISLMHGGDRANAGMADGHVESFKAAEFKANPMGFDDTIIK
ncbi:MAG: hypothetical protein PHI35_09395, partial [Victivallaceae bacterium]|nr:hypothetical protein [Victivallaceae bacterium]